MRIPGTIPARNSFEIDKPAATPKTMKPMLGGMIGPMMPARRDQARRGRLVVARLDHHRHQQRGERRGVGDSRPRQRREQARRHHGDVAQAALDVADRGQRDVDDALREAAGVHDLAGQHEERHRHQRKAVGTVDQVLRDDLRVEDVEVIHQRDAAEQQRVRDRHADRHAAEEREQENGDGHGDLSLFVLPGRVPPGRMLLGAWSCNSWSSSSNSASSSDSVIITSSSSRSLPERTR